MPERDPAAETRGPATDPCACCGRPDAEHEGGRSTTDRYLGDGPVLEATLPGEVQRGLGRLLGRPPVETLAAWVQEVRQQTGGGSIVVDDLCHAGEETGHLGVLDGERYYFHCFYDAVILAALAASPVDVRTVSPGGAVIEARATGADDLTVTPPEAVFSFGIDRTVKSPVDGAPSPSDVYASICPYVRAFPTLAAYERWAQHVPGATVAMPLSRARALAAALVA